MSFGRSGARQGQVMRTFQLGNILSSRPKMSIGWSRRVVSEYQVAGSILGCNRVGSTLMDGRNIRPGSGHNVGVVGWGGDVCTGSLYTICRKLPVQGLV